LVSRPQARSDFDTLTRQIAFELLSRIDNDDAYANLLLPVLLSRAGIEGRDAGFAQELSFGTIRNKLLYEKIIEAASSREISAIEPAAQIVLLLGVHQLLEMRVPAHAAINESVNLAKSKASKGSVGFVNAILRKVSAKSKDEWLDIVTARMSELDALSVQYSHPSWIVSAFKSALSSRELAHELEDLLAGNNTPAKVSLAALPGFSSREELSGPESFGPASPLGVEITGSPGNIKAVRDGHARVQDQGSQLMVLALLEAEVIGEDNNWLDMCAGPGGKAALMAALSIVKGTTLVCNEVSPHRAELVSKALAPLGKFQVTTMDGRDLADAGHKYSRILLDAPCTGLGALRRRPESRWRRSTDDLVDLVKLQRELLESAWGLLEPGGVLAYVTCSPHLSETTAQVAWAQGKFKTDIELMNANVILNSINPKLSLDQTLRTAQLWPHTHGTDAMFIALFRKSIG
jgi:16S rRNA (cytosine967-C5)-methyltransferase